MYNKIRLIGTLGTDLEFNHEFEGEKFYKGKFITKRLSGYEDICNLIISERLMMDNDFSEGKRFDIEGSVRTRNEDGHLIVFVFVESIKATDILADINVFEFEGAICKQPSFRDTPKGTQITDVILACNRGNSRMSTDYIPSVAWNRNAYFLSKQEIGTKLSTTCRLQSRIYQKEIDGVVCDRVVYEASINAMRVLKEDD